VKNSTASPRKEKGGRQVTQARDEPEIMTVEQVAAMLSVHPSTVYRLLKKHEIPAFKLGSDWRFSRERLERWIMELHESKPVSNKLRRRS
jgi:excisionase family DNA binding protein